MTVLNKLLLSVIVLVYTLIATAQLDASVYDAAADFSATTNTGIWTYGTSEKLSPYLFTPYATHSTRTFDPDTVHLDVWSNAPSEPHVAHNGSGVAIFDDPDNILWLPGQLSAHPGPDGQISIIRWTAPFSGFFDVFAAFEGIDEEVGRTDVHVLLDGVSLFDGSVPGAVLSPSSFSTTLAILSGQTLDFAVGYGDNGTYFNDSTAVTARITSHDDAAVTPEAPSIAIWSLVVICALSYLHFGRKDSLSPR